MKRKASAVWRGGLKDGKGTISSESGVLKETQYSSLDFPPRRHLQRVTMTERPKRSPANRRLQILMAKNPEIDGAVDRGMKRAKARKQAAA